MEAICKVPVAAERGMYPERLQMDNGTEFVETVTSAWTKEHGVALDFIEPGKPTQNSYVERFNRTLREEVLDLYIFSTLSEVRAVTEEFVREYNEDQPHKSLAKMPPVEFATHRAGACLSMGHPATLPKVSTRG